MNLQIGRESQNMQQDVAVSSSIKEQDNNLQAEKSSNIPFVQVVERSSKSYGQSSEQVSTEGTKVRVGREDRSKVMPVMEVITKTQSSYYSQLWNTEA